tara:strand:- start:664 stop:1230 length:567 start_codon:yes stop_codon:yes gene_type:complete
MSYKLFTDKQEIFECKISLNGASMNEAKSRIVVKTNKLNLMFEGTIDSKGNCKIPIKKLRGLLGEGVKGTMKLEVIAEDTYFEPWESNFVVDRAKKIKVEVKKQSNPLIKTSKPKIIVKGVKSEYTEKHPVDGIVDMLYEQGVRVDSLYAVKEKILPVLADYSNKIGYKKNTKVFIKEVINKLSKKGK